MKMHEIAPRDIKQTCIIVLVSHISAFWKGGLKSVSMKNCGNCFCSTNAMHEFSTLYVKSEEQIRQYRILKEPASTWVKGGAIQDSCSVSANFSPLKSRYLTKIFTYLLWHLICERSLGRYRRKTTR